MRRHAARRPLYTAIERAPVPDIDADDERLLRAFRQRYDRLAGAAARLSLERLCEQVVSEHDYDLAVLARPDGKRRYANLRKLMRLARSYEELRGPDVEGFVRFVREQEALGARELEAVAEEEDAEAVRLLTIHAAKGLEFKVVVVADGGREKAPPGADEILARPDGRFGFRVVHPTTGDRKPVFDYEAVREAEKEEERAERLRLYYVAMTRAKERLIVSGAVDPAGAAERETPIGWVLRRLAGGEGGLLATEVGDAVHRLLEAVDLAAPVAPDLAEVRDWYPRVTDEELEAIRAFVTSYCESELARRVAALPNAQKERAFAFEHDGVLLHGRLDVLHLDGPRALVVDYKTNSLAEGTPEEIVEADYRLQRLVYALACFRAGAQEVEVVYHFLERLDAVVSTTFPRDELPALEAELSEAIATIQAGDFRPSPDEFTCAGCPVLDVVCAGPRLPNAPAPRPVPALAAS